MSLAGAGLESNLVSQSPFLPPGWGQQAAQKPVEEAPVVQGPLSRELEFRGIFEMGGVTKFSIFDKSTQQSQWVELNGNTDRYSIVRFDEGKDSITVKTGSRMEELTLAKADDKPIPVVGQAPPNFKPPGPPPNFKPPTAPPSSPPSTLPPRNIPPPPPAALMNARNSRNTGGAEPRRRIIRRSDSSADRGSSGSSSTGNSNSNNMPSPPNFTPGPPPSFTPPPPPTNTPSTN